MDADLSILSPSLKQRAYSSRSRHHAAPTQGRAGRPWDGGACPARGNTAAGPARLVPPEPYLAKKRLVMGGPWSVLCRQFSWSNGRPSPRDNRIAGGASACLAVIHCCHLATCRHACRPRHSPLPKGAPAKRMPFSASGALARFRRNAATMKPTAGYNRH